MALFDEATPEETEPGAMGVEHVRTLQVFHERCGDPRVVALCDEIVRLANNLAEIMDVQPDDQSLALLVGLALQRQQVIQAKLEATPTDGPIN